MFRNLAVRTTAYRMNLSSVLSRLQLGLALGALACGWMAVHQGLNMQSSASGLCLGATQNSWLAFTGHCPWCYSALALMALAAWPVGEWNRSNGRG
jgi:hypothetical protein